MLHNLRYNEEVVTFANASGVGAKASLLLDPAGANSPGGGACTAISFRTGNARSRYRLSYSQPDLRAGL